jgi:hypothetical protein
MIRTPIDIHIVNNRIEIYMAELKTPYSFEANDCLNAIVQCIWLTGARYNGEQSTEAISWAHSKSIALRAYDRRVEILRTTNNLIIKVDNIPVYYDTNVDISVATIEKLLRSIFSTAGLDYSIGVVNK